MCLLRRTIVVSQYRVLRCSDNEIVGDTTQLRIPGMRHWLALSSTGPYQCENIVPLRGTDGDEHLPRAIDILDQLPDVEFQETLLPRAPVGYKLQLSNIFWTTIEEARAIARFPWRLLLDSTAKTNRRNVPFVYIAGIDANDVRSCPTLSLSLSLFLSVCLSLAPPSF